MRGAIFVVPLSFCVLMCGRTCGVSDLILYVLTVSYHSSLPFVCCPPYISMGFYKNMRTKLYMRSDAHGERAQKVYALDYCAASFVTEGTYCDLEANSVCTC